MTLSFSYCFSPLISSSLLSPLLSSVVAARRYLKKLVIIHQKVSVARVNHTLKIVPWRVP